MELSNAQLGTPKKPFLEALPNELLAIVTRWLDPADLPHLLACSRAMYKRVVPTLWQHIQFFKPTREASEFAKFSNVNSQYLAMPSIAHSKSKAIAARVDPRVAALDRLAEAILKGHVSEHALDSIQQLTIYTQNRYAIEMKFSGFVHDYLLKPAFLKNLKVVRIINEDSGVIQGVNRHYFDDRQSLDAITEAVNIWAAWKANGNTTENIEVRLFTRLRDLPNRMAQSAPTAFLVTFLHMELSETPEELIKISHLLQKTINLKVFSLSPSKLRPQFSQRRNMTVENQTEACLHFANTLNGLVALESLSLISGMLIQYMNFNTLPSSLQNLELNRQVTTEIQTRGVNSAAISIEARGWKYFLCDVKYPSSLTSFRLNHLTAGHGDRLAPLPPNSIKFNLTRVNFIGHDMPPGSDVELFNSNRHLQVVTMNTISHNGFKLLTTHCSNSLQELTVAKPTGELLSFEVDAFTNESLRLLAGCKQLEYLYLHIFEFTITSDCVRNILIGARRLSSFYLEYSVPGHVPYITEEEIAQYRWFPGLPPEILIPRQKEYDRIRRTFKRQPEDPIDLAEYLSISGLQNDAINDDDAPYVFRDFRIKPTNFGAGCIFELNLPKFKSNCI